MAAEVLPCLVDFESTVDQSPSISVDEVVRLQCSLALLQLLQSQQSRLFAKPSRLLLRILLPVIRHRAVLTRRDHKAVSLSLVESILALLWKTAQYGSQQELYERHANFIVQNLSEKFEDRTTGNVLSDLLAHGGRHAFSMAHSSIRDLSFRVVTLEDSVALSVVRTLREVVQSIAASSLVLERIRPREPEAPQGLFADLHRELDVILGREECSSAQPLPKTESEVKAATDGSDVVFELGKSVFDGCCDLLVDRPAIVVTGALRCLKQSLRILRIDERNSLPLVASLLPRLPFLLEELDNAAAIDKAEAACEVLTELFELAGRFVSLRFSTDLLPLLWKLTCRYIVTSPQGFESLASVGDKALECIAAVAENNGDSLKELTGELVLGLVPVFYRSEDKLSRSAPAAHVHSREIGYLRTKHSKRVKRCRAIFRALAEADGDRSWYYFAVAHRTPTAELEALQTPTITTTKADS